MYCRNHQCRVQICNEWIVKPIAHLKLLNGQTVISDAGAGDITDTYVLFECTNKQNHLLKDTIYCSPTTARDLCKLSDTSLPPVFNPLCHPNNGSRDGNDNHEPSSKIKWDPCRKELYNIVMIMLVYFGKINRDKALYDIKQKLESYITLKPYLSYIKAVNTIIGKTKHKKFVYILDYLKQNNELRDFHYDLVLKELNDNNIPQNLK